MGVKGWAATTDFDLMPQAVKLLRGVRRLAKRLFRPTAYWQAQALPLPLPAAPPVTLVGYIRAATAGPVVTRPARAAN